MRTQPVMRLVILLSVVLGCAGLGRPGGNAAWAQPDIGALDKSEYAPGEVLAKFRPDVAIALGSERLTSSAKLNAALAGFGLLDVQPVFKVERPVRGETYVAPDRSVKPLPDLSRIYRLRFAKDANIALILARLRADKAVVYAEPNYRRWATQSPAGAALALDPNDPYYASQGSWGQSFRDMYGLYSIHAAEGWGITQGSASTIVAVIDTGADLRHPDLAGNLVAGYDFANYDSDPTDGHGHGTHVAGTIAAVTHNGLGVAGICWNCKIMPLKGLGDDGSGYDNNLGEAVRYAADHGAQVTNNSWGSSSFSNVLNDAFAYAYGRGVVSVAAAGNAGNSAPNYPAAYDTVISVSAVDYQDQLAYFSSYGPTVDVAAPGVDILSLRALNTDMYGDGQHIVGGQYYYASGTSMASPHGAGVVAMIRSLHPAWDPAQVWSVLISSADDLGTAGRDDRFGYGRINLYRALQVTTPPPTPTPAPTAVCLAQSPHPYSDSYSQTWTLTNPDSSAASTRVHLDRIETEANYDYVTLKDGAGHVYQRFTGSFADVWSVTIPGRTVQVQLTTDGSVTAWGFCLDQIATGDAVTPDPGACLAESLHPYDNYWNETWSVTIPDAGATSVRVHFSRIDTEAGWDHVMVRDASGNVVSQYSGTYADVWSAPVPGRTAWVQLTTDGSVTSWGFCVDRIEAVTTQTPSPTATFTPTPTLTPTRTPTPSAPLSVALMGPASGITGASYTFSALVTPASADLPIAYTWTATGLASVTHPGGGRSDSVNLAWGAGGAKTVSVTARNAGGQVVASRSIVISLATWGPAARWHTEFGASTGWTSQEVFPRAAADVNGDGSADVVGFGSEGVWVGLSAVGGLGSVTRWHTGFGAAAGAGGWANQSTYPRMLADVNGDGRADVVGFGGAGAYVALANASGTGFGLARLWSNSFGFLPAAGSWATQDLYPRLLADVNGDGRADIVGFGAAGVYVALSTGTAFGPMRPWSTSFGYVPAAGGWANQNTYPRLLADVNGDGKADIVGFGAAGVYVSLSTGVPPPAGRGFAPMTRWTTAFGVNTGWSSQEAYPRTLADVNGDGRADIVGFGAAGAYDALSTGSSFGAITLGSGAFGLAPSAGGWVGQNQSPRLAADMNHDHKADLMGFGADGVSVGLHY